MIATYNFYNGAKIAQTGKACLFVETAYSFCVTEYDSKYIWKLSFKGKIDKNVQLGLKIFDPLNCRRLEATYNEAKIAQTGKAYFFVETAYNFCVTEYDSNYSQNLSFKGKIDRKVQLGLKIFDPVNCRRLDSNLQFLQRAKIAQN